jgi:hypothetical protein
MFLNIFPFPLLYPLVIGGQRVDHLACSCVSVVSFYDPIPIVSLAMIVSLTYRHWGFAVTQVWCPTK